MTTEAVSIGLARLLDAQSSGATPGWLTRVARLLRQAMLSPAEKELSDTVQQAASALGATVLESTTFAELAERIEAAAESPLLVAFSVRALELTTMKMLIVRGGGFASEPPEALVRCLGSAQADRIASAQKLEMSVALAALQLQAITGQSLLAGAKSVQESFPDLLYDSEVPSVIQRSLLRGLQASVAALAIAHALFSERTVDPWMARALTDTYYDGLYEHLRMLAGAPSVVVSEDVLPMRDRYDWEVVYASHMEALSQIDALAESGGELSVSDDDT